MGRTVVVGFDSVERGVQVVRSLVAEAERPNMLVRMATASGWRREEVFGHGPTSCASILRW
jgi:hypothetical protein